MDLLIFVYCLLRNVYNVLEKCLHEDEKWIGSALKSED